MGGKLQFKVFMLNTHFNIKHFKIHLNIELSMPKCQLSMRYLKIYAEWKIKIHNLFKTTNLAKMQITQQPNKSNLKKTYRIKEITVKAKI